MAFDFSKGTPVDTTAAPVAPVNNQTPTNGAIGGFDFSKGMDMPPEPAPANAGDFVAKDIAAGIGVGQQDKDSGFLGGMFQNTLGSNGLMGAFGNLSKAIGAGVAAKAAGGAADIIKQSNVQMAHTTDMLISHAMSLPKEDPMRDSLLNQANQNIQEMARSNAESRRMVTDAEGRTTTAEEIMGRAANAATTIASFAISPISLAQKMIASTGIGAAFGAAGAMTEGKSVKDVAKAAGIGAVAGAATQGAMSGTSGIMSFMTKEMPKWLLTKRLGFTPSQIQKGAHDKAINYILESKKVGSTQGLINRAESAISSLDSQVDEVLSSQSFSKGNVVSNEQIAESTAQRLREAGWTMNAEQILNAVKKHLGGGEGSIYLKREANNVVGANALRKGIDNATKPSQFLSGQNPLEVTAAMEFANTMRAAVKGIVPKTRAMFDEMSKNIALRDAMNISASKGWKLGGVMDTMSAILGLGVGTATGNPVLGVLLGPIAERAAASMGATTAASVSLNQLSKLAPYMAKLTPPMRMFLMQAAAGDRSSREE